MSVEKIMPNLMTSYFGRSKVSPETAYLTPLPAKFPAVPFSSSSRSQAKSQVSSSISVSTSYEIKELKLGGAIPLKAIDASLAYRRAAIELSILRTLYGSSN